MSDNGWHKFPEETPPVGSLLLLIVSGRWLNSELLHSPTIGKFDGTEWMTDEYPEWEDPVVEFWMPYTAYPESVQTEILGVLDGSLSPIDVLDRIMKEAGRA